MSPSIALLALPALAAAMVESPGESFCERVSDNAGCCLACGYKWHEMESACVSEKPATSLYCKLLTKPKHAGCCLACGHMWSEDKKVCVNAITGEGAQVVDHGMTDDSFCHKVQENSGCCPACGYKWDGDKCVTDEPASTPYCKELMQPEHGGCCVFCGYHWSETHGQCVK